MHRWLYRLSGGKIGGTMGGNPVLLLTTTGRKTGQRRIWPVTYLPDGEDLIVVASAGGQPQQPAWYLNLQANPRVTVQVGNQMRRLVAHTAEGEERGRLWARFIQAYPAFEGYQRKTRRELPVVVLRPETATTGQRAAMP
jgi:deazaflavin-dependent oxidoreductase (nitroreductase family)